jgi:hypothetical protein
MVLRINSEHVRFEISTAMTVKNVALWDIKAQFIPHRKHISVTEPSRLMLCKI